MIKISKDAAKYIRENGRGFDVHVSSRTHRSSAKRYYLTESYKSLKLLEKFNKSKVSSK